MATLLILLIIGAILIAVGIVVALLQESATAVLSPFTVFLGSVLVFGAIFSAYKESRSNVPTALDVYRGNTTLEITYRDSMAVDTVVVFKSK